MPSSIGTREVAALVMGIALCFPFMYIMHKMSIAVIEKFSKETE